MSLTFFVHTATGLKMLRVRKYSIVFGYQIMTQDIIEFKKNSGVLEKTNNTNSTSIYLCTNHVDLQQIQMIYTDAKCIYSGYLYYVIFALFNELKQCIYLQGILRLTFAIDDFLQDMISSNWIQNSTNGLNCSNYRHL